MAKNYCLDCEKRIVTKEYFMVSEQIWEEYGVGKNHLCVNCFEKRLGRKMTAFDLQPNIYINEKVNPYTMKILGKL